MMLLVFSLRVCRCYRTYIHIFITFRSSHRDGFLKFLFFFSRSNPFTIFPGGSICSSNRHVLSRRVYMFIEQTRIFQECLSKRHVFSKTVYLFVEQTLLSHRTDTNFPRNHYFVLEHI